MDIEGIYKECKKLWDTYDMLPNIRQHSLVVTEVAFFIGTKLSSVQDSLSLEKIIKGALMHDIAKTITIRTGGDHCRLGKEICETHGFTDILDIVEEHVRLKEFPSNGVLCEKHIVCYADKRVMHSQVVTLEERLKDILKRYAYGKPEAEERILRNFEDAKRLEMIIFEKINLKPENLYTHMREENLGYMLFHD